MLQLEREKEDKNDKRDLGNDLANLFLNTEKSKKKKRN